MDDTIERLGRLVDKADNFLALAGNPFIDLPMLVDALTQGVTELRQDIYDLRKDLGGEDMWQ